MANQKLIEEKMKLSEQELLLEWYDEEMKKTVGGSVYNLVGVSDDLKTKFLNWSKGVSLYQKICVDWKYCEKKDNSKSLPEIIGGLADFISSALGVPTPYTISILIVKFGFDKICNCEGKR